MPSPTAEHGPGLGDGDLLAVVLDLLRMILLISSARMSMVSSVRAGDPRGRGQSTAVRSCPRLSTSPGFLNAGAGALPSVCSARKRQMSGRHPPRQQETDCSATVEPRTPAQPAASRSPGARHRTATCIALCRDTLSTPGSRSLPGEVPEHLARRILARAPTSDRLPDCEVNTSSGNNRPGAPAPRPGVVRTAGLLGSVRRTEKLYPTETGLPW